jgi:hypothetical protein
MIRTKSGRREHPLIKHEIAARALTAKLLQKLGLDVEPVRPAKQRAPAWWRFGSAPLSAIGSAHAGPGLAMDTN